MGGGGFLVQGLFVDQNFESGLRGQFQNTAGVPLSNVLYPQIHKCSDTFTSRDVRDFFVCT